MKALRDRIANAIRRAGYRHSYAPGPYLAGIYADAVIEELKLTPSDNFSYRPDDELPETTKENNCPAT